MRLSDWVDVELEGRGVVLQRAFADYRSFRRALDRDWRAHTQALAQRSERTAVHEDAVDEALERARRRMKQGRVELEPLIVGVERERERLVRRAAAVVSELGGAAPTCGAAALFGVLGSALRDEGPLESAWNQFAAEKLVFFTFAVLFGIAAPLSSWWTASEGGAIPTVFAPRALVASSAAGAAFLTGALIVLAWLVRASTWAWIGVRPPTVGLAAALVGLVATLVAWSFSPLDDRMNVLLALGIAGVFVGTISGLRVNAVPEKQTAR